MQIVEECVLEPKSGAALTIQQGQHFRVTEIEGKQVVDLAVFNMANLNERLSTSYSRTRKPPGPDGRYRPSDRVGEGDVLLSTICRPMLTILHESMDQKGVHDVHNRMCNRALYEMHGIDDRDGCLEIIAKAVAPYGILPEDIPDTIDLFMNYQHNCTTGGWAIHDPITEPGDYIEMRAEMDCLLAMSNCPEDTLTRCNAGQCKRVHVAVVEP